MTKMSIMKLLTRQTLSNQDDHDRIEKHIYLYYSCPSAGSVRMPGKDFGEFHRTAHLQSSVFKLSKDLIDSIHEEGIVAYTS